MQDHKVVSRDEWMAARMVHLRKEKEFTRLRDELGRERRELPWVKVGKPYSFEGPDGTETLAELFGDRSQLIVQHFMFGPEWPEGCPSCSFWADNYDGVDIHLEHRDISFVSVSRAPSDKIDAYKKRMGWSFKWVSSLGSDFNSDYRVSFTAEQKASDEALYNFGTAKFPADEAPGASVFFKDDHGDVFHTYSCYARGLDMLNGAYHYIDLTPKGRNEAELSYTQAWVRRHDQYEE